MKRSRYSESQIISILKEAESGIPVAELCRKHGMSDATFYNWRAKYGGMDVSMMKRMKELEDENRRLKKMYAEEKLKAEIIQEAMEKKCKAISTQGDGTTCSKRTGRFHPIGL
jgi:putative transposase